MTQVLLDEVINTDYGQFDLVWSPDGGFDGDHERFFADQSNGLVGASDAHGVYLSFGRRSGGSHVRAVVLAEAPEDAAPEWEDVVEVSIELPRGMDPRWMSWAAETSGPLNLAPGSYRLRVSAKGRDAGAADEFAEAIIDRYLLEFWQAPKAADHISRVGSDDARYWHSEWGGRR